MSQDRPDAPELLEAVAEFLFTDVREWAPREKRFQVLVAANVCAVVARELRAGDKPLREDLALFGELLGEEPQEPASSEARKPTSAAASAGSAIRPAGRTPRSRSRTSAGIARTFSVATIPGSTALAVRPRAAFSAAIVFTMPSSPALEAE